MFYFSFSFANLVHNRSFWLDSLFFQTLCFFVLYSAMLFAQYCIVLGSSNEIEKHLFLSHWSVIFLGLVLLLFQSSRCSADPLFYAIVLLFDRFSLLHGFLFQCSWFYRRPLGNKEIAGNLNTEHIYSLVSRLPSRNKQ